MICPSCEKPVEWGLRAAMSYHLDPPTEGPSYICPHCAVILVLYLVTPTERTPGDHLSEA